jgi:hypothetical protein
LVIVFGEFTSQPEIESAMTLLRCATTYATGGRKKNLSCRAGPRNSHGISVWEARKFLCFSL